MFKMMTACPKIFIFQSSQDCHGTIPRGLSPVGQLVVISKLNG